MLAQQHNLVIIKWTPHVDKQIKTDYLFGYIDHTNQVTTNKNIVIKHIVDCSYHEKSSLNWVIVLESNIFAAQY